jgi:glycosyltransferase involved in cell wall biosynthesis
MNIVFIGPFGLRKKGTMAVRALPLAKALAARGHQVTLLLPPWDSPEDAGRAWIEESVSITHIPLPRPAPWSPLAITAQLLRAAGELRPDVIHCFKPKAYAGLAAWALWHLRGGRKDNAEGQRRRESSGSAYRLVVDADDWEGAGGWNDIGGYTWAQRRFFAWQERWGLTHADAITVASRALQTLSWSLGASPEQVCYLPNGVTESPSPHGDGQRVRAKYQLGAAPAILLYTRFFEFSVERVLRLLARVRQERPDARLLVVGRGFQREEDELLRLAREGWLAEFIAYAGWVEPDELPDYFAAADLAIYPFDDTLINRCKCAVKLLDLLRVGVPVIAEAVGQNVEYIQDGVSGLLVPPGDEDAFAGSVLRLLGDDALRRRLGEHARDEIVARFGWSRLAETAERAYQGL